MKAHDYARILAALDAALEVFQTHPARFGFELETYERLQELRAKTAEARERARRHDEGAA